MVCSGTGTSRRSAGHDVPSGPGACDDNNSALIRSRRQDDTCMDRQKKPPQSVVRCGGFFRMHKVIKEIGSFLSGVLRLMEERLDFASDPAGAAAGEPASH